VETDAIPILALRERMVLLPGAILAVTVGRRKSVRLVEEALKRQSQVIGVVTQRVRDPEDPGGNELFQVGCTARITRVIKLSRENFWVSLQGISRFEVKAFAQVEPFFTATVQGIAESTGSDAELDALRRDLRDLAKRVTSMPEIDDASGAAHDAIEPGRLADLVASRLVLDVTDKQELLETFDPKARIRKVVQLLSRPELSAVQPTNPFVFPA